MADLMNQNRSKILPSAELQQLNIGYMRLSDSAPIIIAQEKGFYDQYDLDVNLHREVSWANIRDKLIAGSLDASQMLAPMPLITTLGAAGIRAPMLTGLVLSLNGNGITVTPPLWEKMRDIAGLDTNMDRSSLHNSVATAKALGKVVNQQQPITFATVHSFSSHTILLRMWLKAGGIDPDRDARIIVLPPEQMVDSLAQGVIDGFCVGEPWNSIAVEYGVGILATTGFGVWNNAPEKVLGVLEDWHTSNPATHLRLRLALMEACRWLANMDNRDETIAILSRDDYLGLSPHYLRASLIGEIAHDRAENPLSHPNFHVFSRFNAGFPWRSQATYMLEQCSPLLGKSLEESKLVSLAQQCFRTDLYREAARLLGIPSPDQDHKTEGMHDQPWMLDEQIELGSDLMISDD